MPANCSQSFLRCTLTAALLGVLGGTATADELIPYELFTLDNGLTLIVHEDRKAPIVAVNIWYHVGSRNETPGKTGYAHLFEHLMFQGSANAPGEYLELVERVGATDLNGTTWFDRTNYYQTVPKGALDRVLFLESDRMGHMLEAIDQAVLDEQRGVVQNEKRQGDNEPYSKIWKSLLQQLFPPDHPYSWRTIGRMADLEAATLEDMQEWFRTYYGPNNAVLVVAGDVDAAAVRERVQYYFGDIPPGPPLSVLEEWIPRHTSERREIMQDRVPQERIYLAWTGPRWGTRDAHQLQLAVDVLAGGKNSRLYERLVYRDRLATSINLAAYYFEISGMLIMELSVTPGADIAEVERIAREELEALLRNGPDKRELERVKAATRAGFIRGVERIGGPGSKSDVLAANMIYGKDPGYYQKQLDDVATASLNDVREVAQRWFSQAPYVAHIVPYPSLTAATRGTDRTAGVPEALPPAPAVFPEFRSTTLSNGMRLLVAHRPTVPVVEFNLIFDAGYAADPAERAGEAGLTMAMLDEGAGKLDALQISEQLTLLGASLSATAGIDSASVRLSALRENLDPSLRLFADVILNPTFPEGELERLREQYLNTIRQEKTRPLSIALRLLPQLLYGDGHAYAQPLSGTGTETSVQGISRDDLVEWHRTWLRPNNATLVVTGDATLEDITPRIEKLFNNWKPGEVPVKNIRAVESPISEVLYLIDRPAAQQSIIFAGQLVVPMSGPDEEAIKAMNDILGGQFSSRINMNLREEKGWSYGARSLLWPTQAQRPFIAYAPVQSDKTTESVAELRRELTEIVSSRPPAADELERVQLSRTLSLPGRWETNTAVLGAMSEVISYALPDDYWSTYAERINALSPDAVAAAARNTLNPGAITWVVVGDRARIEPGLRELGIADIRLLDADGNVLSD